MQLEHRHAGVQVRVDGHALVAVVVAVDEAVVVFDADAGGGEQRVVGRLEGVETRGVDLDAAVAAEQLRIEADAHFRHHRPPVRILGRGDLHGGDEVLLAVRAGLPDGQLAAREDDRLAQVLEHEAQGGGGVGHRVRAVQDHEAVVVVVAVADQRGEGLPEGGLDVGGVDDRVEGIGIDLEGELAQLGHFLEDAAEVEGLQGAVHGVGFHADGAAGVDQQHGIGTVLVREQFEIQLHRLKSLFAFAVVTAATSSRLTPFCRARKSAMMGM